MAVVIKSGAAGFVSQAKSGESMTVQYSLSNLQNSAGTFVNVSGSDRWVGADALDGSNMLTEFTASPPLIKADYGQIETIYLDEASLIRFEMGVKVDIGTINFGKTIGSSATYDDQSNGAGWSTDLAAQFTDMVQTDGLKFLGSDKADIFDPFAEPQSYDHTTVVRLKGGDDHATGTKGDDLIIGGAGDDDLHDDFGSNILRGGAGDDTITFGNTSQDNLGKGNAGNDTLTSGSGNDRLNGGSGHDTLIGNKGSDILRGQSGRDSLFGGDDDDTLDGGSGRDMLEGGRGDDMLTGGAGRDTFKFFQNTDGHDTITDFEVGQDWIYLPDIGGEFDKILMNQEGDNTVITIPSTDFSVTLEQIEVEDLDEDDFIF